MGNAKLLVVSFCLFLNLLFFRTHCSRDAVRLFTPNILLFCTEPLNIQTATIWSEIFNFDQKGATIWSEKTLDSPMNGFYKRSLMHNQFSLFFSRTRKRATYLCIKRERVVPHLGP
jgi:hypothetical protein